MQIDFHYYAAYCAAYLAGYSVEESAAIAYSNQLVDYCTRTLLKKADAPLAAATSQLQGELAKARTDLVGLQDITRIWASFHFLPRDLNAPIKVLSPSYRSKYRLICGPNGELVKKTVCLAKDASPEAAGIAMHVLSDTWAHAYFAGTPSQVINDTNMEFYEILPDEAGTRRRINFRHSTSTPDDPETASYTNSINYGEENSVMNLGHGRAGHLPDYSYMRYEYLPAWGRYESIVKDNPSDYLHAFGQMVYALQYLHGDREEFCTSTYATDVIAPWEEKIRTILEKRQLNASADWEALGLEMTGTALTPFCLDTALEEYLAAEKEAKDDTVLGRFIIAAMRQKSMVTNSIYSSGNKLAGISVDYREKGFRGIRDFRLLVDYLEGRRDS